MATPATQHHEHKVVSKQEWLAARKALLAKEKQLTRQTDAITAERLALPWVKVEKNYVFDTPSGKKCLADLFEGRSQLIVKHFMFGPGWNEGCVGCSFGSDHVEGALVHLEHHDVSYVAISRAPLAEIEPFKKRMGWHFNWVSSADNDFNYDYNVSFRKEDAKDGQVLYNYQMSPFMSEEASGLSFFYKDSAGNAFHTYSTFGRGDEKMVTTYMLLDMTPKGRNETGRGNLSDWVRHHDQYEAGGHVDYTGRYVAEGASQPGATRSAGGATASKSTQVAKESDGGCGHDKA
jgi:predicted dithiol-disulfide oxidoreductase (DUF899 family)